jgi:hypothetical protein
VAGFAENAFMSSNTARDFRRIFAMWPADLPRTGMVVTTFGENVPFCGFMIAGELLLLERKTPDSTMARRVMIGFDAINALKIIDPIEMPKFKSMGFEGPV